MRPNTLVLALSLALLSLPLSALAQDAAETADPAQESAQAAAAPAEEAEAEPDFTWNLSLTTDYVFRGVTQSNYKPALQGGLDYSFGDSGFYVGAWGSNIDFADPDGPDIELDTFAGWNHDLSEQWNLDLSLVHYSYFGERDGYGSADYTEAFAKVSWKEMLTFTAAYAPDYSNLDYSSLYFNVAGSWDIGKDFSVNAAVGHSDFSEGNGSYTDWNLGLSRQFGPVNAAINYYDTSLEGGRASDTVVFTLGFGS
jgi:uncharacterized protein (TIGR02001 family)